ncbi:hypothetical protein DSO57_1036690 [Entomophthora muscae]|uniref:Uncharacterized protein n=1 Tax=Entomophthora muscae TaxID=34485 RepID=A0ACC2TX23_9FUNG|nr:hypothetical protein DSO57_1036690 [Entomophthora muscae]
MATVDIIIVNMGAVASSSSPAAFKVQQSQVGVNSRAVAKFISNKQIAANPPTPKASDILSELTLTHKLKHLPSGEFLLLNDNGPSSKDRIICYATQQNLMELKRASTWLVDSTFALALDVQTALDDPCPG